MCVCKLVPQSSITCQSCLKDVFVYGRFQALVGEACKHLLMSAIPSTTAFPLANKASYARSLMRMRCSGGYPMARTTMGETSPGCFLCHGIHSLFYDPHDGLCVNQQKSPLVATCLFCQSKPVDQRFVESVNGCFNHEALTDVKGSPNPFPPTCCAAVRTSS